MVKQILGRTEPYKFILGARDPNKAKKEFEDLNYDRKTHSLTVLPLELSDLKGVKHFAQQTLEELGRNRIDYLFLNAGLVKSAKDPGPHGSKWCEPFVVNHLCTN